jgi:hypothetical protein
MVRLCSCAPVATSTGDGAVQAVKNRARVLVSLATRAAPIAAIALLAVATGSALAAPPFALQGGRFTGSETLSGARFGQSVALASDGNTALVGAPQDGGGAGAAWVFTRTGGAWTQQGTKITGAGESGSALFGTSVDLSSDGNTAVVGGPADNGEAGAAWVFTRSGSTWTQQGEKLTGKNETAGAGFGRAVAVAGDGNTTLVGAPHNNGEAGAAWVFERSGGIWKQRKKLTGKGQKELFGLSVSLADDGDTALVGSPSDAKGYGAAWAFRRVGKSWTHPGEKLVGSPGEVRGYGPVTGRGRSVTLSGDGTTALIGGYGTAWVFTSAGSAWEQQGPVMEDSLTYPYPPDFGHSVALSYDGDEGLVGAPLFGEFKGEVWVLTRAGSTWTHAQSLGGGRCPTENPCGHEFGASSALSSDGETALIGGPAEETGFAWAFAGTP